MNIFCNIISENMNLYYEMCSWAKWLHIAFWHICKVSIIECWLWIRFHSDEYYCGIKVEEQTTRLPEYPFIYHIQTTVWRINKYWRKYSFRRTVKDLKEERLRKGKSFIGIYKSIDNINIIFLSNHFFMKIFILIKCN